VIVADVRGRTDLRDAVRVGLARHRDAVAKVECAVVDAGEDVAVQVDHRPDLRLIRRSYRLTLNFLTAGWASTPRMFSALTLKT
jgi:hypothetical protein